MFTLHTRMLDSVVEFITEAASSTAFIFCFCNLIIVIILVDLKPSLNFDQEISAINPAKFTLVNKNASSHQAGEVSHANEEAATTTKWSRLHESDKAIVSYHRVCEEVVAEKIESGGSDDICCNEEEEEREDDELRRRVEEFIEKINEGWKAEYSGTSSLL